MLVVEMDDEQATNLHTQGIDLSEYACGQDGQRVGDKPGTAEQYGGFV